GSAAKHHRMYAPWLPPENVNGGMVGLRGAVAPEAGLFRRAAREVAAILKAEGVGGMPIGVDIVEPPMLEALRDEGLTVCDAQKTARHWIDASIELMKPGVGTDQVAKVWPKAEEFGFSSEMECFGLQFGHSVGLFLHERPIISRLNSLDHPVEIKEGMVIAL